MARTPHEPESARALVQRAHRAKAAKEAADAEWSVVRDELRRLARGGGLGSELEREVAALLGEDEHPRHPHRFRPSPS